jgi:hypothetical protein
LWQLTRPRPARFGWQMYAGLAQASEFTSIHRDGSRATAPLDHYIIRPRDDLDLLRYLPPAICARTGAAAVRYLPAPGHQPVEIVCRR